MNSATQSGNGIDLTAEQQRIIRAFTLAATAGIAAYHTFMGNYLSLYINQFGFSPMLIGILFLAIQIPSICQIWVARHTDRYGCKKILRVFSAIAPIALLPLIFSPQIRNLLGQSIAVTSVFFACVAYAAMIAIARVGWMPLLRHNLPLGNRTQLVGRINQRGMIGVFLITTSFSLFLKNNPSLLRFQLIFAFAGILIFLRAVVLHPIHDIEPKAHRHEGSMLGAMREIWKVAPFRRLCMLIFLYFLSIGIINPFRPIFLKSLGFSNGFAAFATSSLTVVAFALATQLCGRLADKHGSRALLATGAAGYALCVVATLLAKGSAPLDRVIVMTGLMGMSACWAALDAGFVHRLFSVVPKEGQSLYMVMYVLALNLSLSAGSFLGGLLAQSARKFIPESLKSGAFGAGMEYRFVFVAASVVMLLGMISALRIRSMKESSVPHLLLYIRLSAQRWLMARRSGAAFWFQEDVSDEN